MGLEMELFENVEMAPPDAILGLNAAYAADTRENKINLGVGAYKTEDLKPFVLKSVREAEKLLLEQDLNKEYLPIGGEPHYVSEIRKLVLGEKLLHLPSFVLQTLGGTGALRIGANLLHQYVGQSVTISDPSWDNHRRIFTHAGFKVDSYPYYDQKNHGLDFQAFCLALEKMAPHSVVVLQGACHNPTGIDPTFEEWKEIHRIMEKKKLFPFFDLAYQGFGEGLEEDVRGLRYFVEQGSSLLIATSYSKNFGLYAERVGSLIVVCQEKVLAKVESQAKVIIRGIYSNPPIHGARLVATILKDKNLRILWEKELLGMRLRISNLREALVSALQSKGLKVDFIRKQRGMFSYTGLTKSQVESLHAKYAIYMPKDGRINIAGLNQENLIYVVNAIGAVIS